MAEVHFTSIVVQVQPDHAAVVAQAIGAFSGAEIHGDEEVGKLVVGFETADLGEVTQNISTIQTMPGVVSAVLVYHHIEDDENLDETIEVEQASTQNPTVEVTS